MAQNEHDAHQYAKRSDSKDWPDVAFELVGYLGFALIIVAIGYCSKLSGTR